MRNYRFKASEVEQMKADILCHIENEEEGNKTAWRLRIVLEGMAWCVRCSKREKAKREREVELYHRLTKNDLPNWEC